MNVGKSDLHGAFRHWFSDLVGFQLTLPPQLIPEIGTVTLRGKRAGWHGESQSRGTCFSNLNCHMMPKGSQGSLLFVGHWDGREISR